MHSRVFQISTTQIDKENYLIAEMILRREHQIEMEKENE